MKQLLFFIAAHLACLYVIPQGSDVEEAKWKQLHYDIRTIDTHCDLPMKMSWYNMGEEHDFGYVDLPRMKKGGLDGEFMAVFIPQGPLDTNGREKAFKNADEIIDLIEKQSRAYPQLCQTGKSVEDFLAITGSGRICILTGMENGYPIGQDINKLDYFYNRGVRYITLCHFEDNDICDSSTDDKDPDDHGLSSFGIEVVKRMNDLGMIIDVSHISRKSFFDVLKYSHKPVIASHSCVNAIKEHPQNLTDEQLLAIKKNGGVVNIDMVPDHLRYPVEIPEMKIEMDRVLSWLESEGGYEKLNSEQRDYFTKETRRIKLKYPEGVGLVTEFVDHIDYVKNLIGIDHVGIGTDFEGGGCLGDCYTVLEIPNITIELLRRGYNKSDIEKIWGGNFLRVFKEVQDTGTNIISSNIQKIPSGCTVITAVKGNKVFFGGNDDYINPDSYYWVERGDSSKYGVIWIGTPDNPQQGVNEMGLAYDANGLPAFDVNPHSERTPVDGKYYHNYVMQIMHECSTVKEVMNWINTHQRFSYMHDQLHFADKTGDAVIVSAGNDGEMVFTKKKDGDGFLVSSNFNVANPSNGFDYPCQRYDKANELLGQLIDRAEPLNVNDITDVLDTVHQEKSSWTIETLVADLSEGIIYLYYFYQYDDPVIINLKDELAGPRSAGPLSSLFPENVQKEAANRYRHVTKTIRINNFVGKSWTALIIISLVFLLILPRSKKGLRFWIPAIIVLGPIDLILKLITLRSVNASLWKEALIETTGNLVPVVIAFLVSQVILILRALSGGVSKNQQVLYILGLPLMTAWIIFHSPLLAATGKKNIGRFMFQRLPQVIVVTIMGLGGIFPLAMPLVNKTIAMSQLIPLSPWIVMTWLLIIVTGSIIGGIFIFFYETWALKRGYRAWTVFSGYDGEVMTPGWGEIWYWLIISILILFAGLISGVMLMKVMAG